MDCGTLTSLAYNHDAPRRNLNRWPAHQNYEKQNENNRMAEISKDGERLPVPVRERKQVTPVLLMMAF
jgi:hypothetical protein